MRKSKVGLKDVAREAGVSIATVSYVVNNTASQTLTPETIQRVNEAVKKLGYVPNMAARALASDSSRMIGVVIPQMEPNKEFMFSNPFYGEFLSAVEYAARCNGYHILISGADANQTYLQVARIRSLDGVIIVGMYSEDDYAGLKKIRIPVVLVDSYCDDHYFHSVQIDDRQGGYMAVKYLLGKGHRRIAHVTGLLKGNGVNQWRMRGWREALEEAGVAFDRSLLYDGEVSREYGIKAGTDLAGSFRATSVTAVFASADILALGLYKGLRAGGVSVPSDISVVSFDDTWLADTCDPGLTAVRQDVAAKGRAAVEIVIGTLNGSMKGKQELTLPIHMVERGSVCGR